VRLRLGDELLVLAPRKKLERLRREADFVVLQEMDVPVLHPARAVAASLIIAGVVAVAAFGVYPVAVCALSGCVAMVLTGVLPPRKVYDSIDWRVIFLLAGVIPLGKAMETTGAAEQAVSTALSVLGAWGPQVVLSVFFLATYLLTGFMSNNATAALMVPLALTTAAELDVASRPFLVAIAFAASAAFYTPVGYQTNLLVYGPGGYRFSDYTRVGGPLNLLYWGIATVLIPILFPF